MITEDQTEVVRFLSDPLSYGTGADGVQRIDTHGAVVFLTGDRAYKMKRAVYFEYMDFSTLARRERFCRAEVELNSRTAPDLYIGVVAVTRSPEGSFALNGGGEAVEWLVEMHRFEESGVLDKVALRGEFDDRLAAQLAETACDFLAFAEVHREEDACDTIADIVAETARLLPEGVGSMFEKDDVDRLTRAQRGAVERLGPSLEARRLNGFVRHGHGDFHLRNVCLIDCRPTLFDAIEFNDRLAISDVLYDLAFLLMDLIHRNLGAQANLILNRYLERTGDYVGIELLSLYLSVRAGIRAFTAVPAAASQSDPEVAERVRVGAREYLALAAGFLERSRPTLAAVGGLSGSGKSTQAKVVAPLLPGSAGGVVLRSDVMRKTMLGKAETERLGPEGYSREMSGRVYEALRSTAAKLLAAGHSVVVDAVHANEAERTAIAAVAAAADADFTGLWFTAELETMAARIEKRTHDASDATVEVLRQQSGYDLGDLTWRRISTDGSKEQTSRLVREALGRAS